MPTPYESKEFFEGLKWREKAKSKLLTANNCIASWTDICGFGSLLKEAEWNLSKLQLIGAIELLNEVYEITANPLLPNIDPYPNDKIIILNDGIARTVDLKYKKEMDSFSFLIFFRNMIFNHYYLLEITRRYNVGIRTVFAGGQRIQYSRPNTTGHSLLYYDTENVSDYGKQLLDTTFVYNPAEFQMNTAFAKAFTIDSLGTKENIKVNGLYIEEDFLVLMGDIKNIDIKFNNSLIEISYKKKLVFNLNIAEKLIKNLKGINVEIYHIDKYHIYSNFDGDDLDFDLFRTISN